MEENKSKYKGEWYWIFSIRIVGWAMFFIPLYLPFRAYLSFEIEKVPMQMDDILLIATGFVLVASGKTIGTLANNIGIILTNFLKKFTN